MDIQTYREVGNWISGQKLTEDKIVSKEEAHNKGLLHLSTHLLVIDSKNDILCRKRTENDFHYAGLWTTTIGTHVPLNQGYQEILIEYFPLKIDLKWIGEFRVHDEFENEINGLYITYLNGEKLDKEFTKDRCFISLQRLENIILFNQCTPHLKEAYVLFRSESKP